MLPADDILVALTTAASDAEAREATFRTEMAITAKRLETERATAFRRLNFMRTLAGLATTAETGPDAVLAAQAHIRAQFGWDTDSEARSGVLEAIAPVALALHAASHPDVPAGSEAAESAPPEASAPPAPAMPPVTGRDPATALATFEAWYEQTRASSFWFLFEHYMPETPRVDY